MGSMRLSLQGGVVVFLLFLGLLVCTAPAADKAEETVIPRPEHPRPQMQRLEWLNLNGVWEFAEADEAQDERFLGADSYPDEITVPFCRESLLSGLGRRGFVKHVWYRRRFSLPGEWRSPRARLHIGACDWRTRVWVNGRPVGEHTGGSAPFAFEITEVLQPGENVVVIHAFDDTRSGLQALGKQSNREDSFGIFYTRTTGIWQTVWLEGVGRSFLRGYCLTSDSEHSRVLLDVALDGFREGLTITATAFADGKRVGRAETAAGGQHNPLVLSLAKKRLWSVEDPFLYDLELTLSRGKTVVDQVRSYFGLRTVSVEGPAILINGRRVFQRLVLDQGFYPDGIWTAPSDAALKGDIERSQALGFNGARLHQKVFEPRFLYWADRLGYLVWGEFPSFGADYGNPAVNLPIINEWVEIVRRDYNHPSIIGWCPFNETPRTAGPLQQGVVNLTRELDPTRVVLETSGWSHTLPDSQLLDAHDY
ncbi:MAG TPA: beta-galactosidase, partial [Firmicutes bacterium]|nr:beta-galactosidase [Bacillota bacterium]